MCHFNWLSSRKYGTAWYYPASSKFVSNYFSSFVSFRKIDWHASGFITCVKPASFGLLCAWRGVLILRQHTFRHARWDPLADSRCLTFKTSWMSPLMTCLQNTNCSWKMPLSSFNWNAWCHLARTEVVYHTSSLICLGFCYQGSLIPRLLKRNERFW
jgi:hypothetical protein